jgi:hypothetical protein
MEVRVTEAMNEMVLKPLTLEDVKKGLWGIGDLKAPGPDGLHAVFYERFWWVMMENELVSKVLRAINSGVISA